MNCPECGRKLNVMNSTRFTERTCLGIGWNGKNEYTTTSFTVCNVCATYVEQGIANGRAQAGIMAAHRRRVGE